MFIEPEAQGSGIGRALFEWAVTKCKDHRVSTLVIDADPGAAPFYRRMGAKDVGLVASGSISGRFIPRLEFPVREMERG